jgi:glycosyltransferase involved in cell wall biosynthesis
MVPAQSHGPETVNEVRVILAVPSWSLNGPVVFSANLARELLTRGIDVRLVLTRPDWVDMKPLPPPSDLPVDTLPLRRHAFRSARERWDAMAGYLDNLAPCIYVPNHDFWHSCVSPELGSQVITCGVVHSDDPEHYEHVQRLGEFWNAIVAVSPFIGQHLVSHFPAFAERVAVIPYGVPAAFEYPIRDETGGRELRVIYAGRLDQKQKRILDLPRILQSTVQELAVPVTLTVAGEGVDAAALRAVAQSAGVAAQIRFAGVLGQDPLLQEYRQHDVFLLPSAFEGLPLAMLEAMGQGCIPVATRTRSGAAEVIRHGENGFLHEIGDVAGMAQSLREIWKAGPEKRGLWSSAHFTIQDQGYGVAAMADRYLALFHRLAGTAFSRKYAPAAKPPQMPWTETLPAPVQIAGNWIKRRLGLAR